jgi:hypothetical protein
MLIVPIFAVSSSVEKNLLPLCDFDMSADRKLAPALNRKGVLPNDNLVLGKALVRIRKREYLRMYFICVLRNIEVAFEETLPSYKRNSNPFVVHGMCLGGKSAVVIQTEHEIKGYHVIVLWMSPWYLLSLRPTRPYMTSGPSLATNPRAAKSGHVIIWKTQNHQISLF